MSTVIKNKLKKKKEPHAFIITALQKGLLAQLQFFFFFYKIVCISQNFYLTDILQFGLIVSNFSFVTWWWGSSTVYILVFRSFLKTSILLHYILFLYVPINEHLVCAELLAIINENCYEYWSTSLWVYINVH